MARAWEMSSTRRRNTKKNNAPQVPTPLNSQKISTAGNSKKNDEMVEMVTRQSRLMVKYAA
jgi:hypothetical protein